MFYLKYPSLENIGGEKSLCGEVSRGGSLKDALEGKNIHCLSPWRRQRAQLQAWTLTAGLLLVFKWALNAPAGLKCARATPATHLCLCSPSLHGAPQGVSEARRRIFGKNSLFLAFFLFFGLNFHPHESHFQGTFRALRFQKSSSKVWRFSENGKSEFFGARRFRLKDFSSEEVNPWCLNSILCWKLLLPLITSDTLN